MGEEEGSGTGFQVSEASGPREWLISVLQQHVHLPRREVVRQAAQAGHSESTVERAARAVGVLVHRLGRDSEWYPPSATEVDLASVAERDPEISIINHMSWDGSPRARSEVLDGCLTDDPHNEKTLMAAARRLRLVETRKKGTGRGPYKVFWQFEDGRDSEAEHKLWIARQKLSPL